MKTPGLLDEMVNEAWSATMSFWDNERWRKFVYSNSATKFQPLNLMMNYCNDDFCCMHLISQASFFCSKSGQCSCTYGIKGWKRQPQNKIKDARNIGIG